MKRIARSRTRYNFEDYSHIISPLSEEDGGGFLITFPDLPGCMSDGETIAEAMKNGKEAFQSWASAWQDIGRSMPEPSFAPSDAAMEDVSGKFIARVPKSIHKRLTAKAKTEGVSLNTLVVSLLSEGLGRKLVRS